MPYSPRGSNASKNYRDERLRLVVLLCGRVAGVITVFQFGHASFTYDSDYEGPDLSVRMPFSPTPYLDDVVRPWIEGLLPDNPEVLEAMAKEA